MLDKIGVDPGWHCLDVGCGPGGITALLSERVGTSGRVVGLDTDPVFLDHARRHAPGNVEFMRGDAYHSDLPSAAFDLVHLRFVASTAGEPEALLGEAIRLARPAGIVAVQEPDMAALNCYPSHPAFASLKAALEGGFASVGADIRLAQRLFALARHAGLENVQYRPFLVGVRASDTMVDYLPATVESLRRTILDRGLMKESELDAALADCRRHLHNPDTVFTTYIVAQVWGRTAGAEGRRSRMPNPMDQRPGSA
jgi:SAM-dependent methyltransferase